jgi:hypothetical protein
LMLLAAISLSGCVYIESVFQPAPTIVPVVTITPTPAPTATPVPSPTPVARQMSTDVKLMPVGEKGILPNSFDSHKNSEDQWEYFTIVLANDGKDMAKNVVITLIETDAHGGSQLVQQKISIGDMSRGERKEYTVETEHHAMATSVMITIDCIEWGENGEYYNPTKYINLAKSVWT